MARTKPPPKSQPKQTETQNPKILSLLPYIYEALEAMNHQFQSSVYCSALGITVKTYLNHDFMIGLTLKTLDNSPIHKLLFGEEEQYIQDRER